MPAKQGVNIKGTKDGLVFILDDQVPFSDLLQELSHKIEHTHHQLLSGPIVHVDVKLGTRKIVEEEKKSLLEIFGKKGNLIIRSFQNIEETVAPSLDYHVVSGIIRSGQSVSYEGNILLLGDVNPGGTVCSTGDIYILGALRGMAHAGMHGNLSSIIAASHLFPTQLRIAEVVTRPPDENEARKPGGEFAYYKDGIIQVEKIHLLSKVRKNSIGFKGV